MGLRAACSRIMVKDYTHTSPRGALHAHPLPLPLPRCQIYHYTHTIDQSATNLTKYADVCLLLLRALVPWRCNATSKLHASSGARRPPETSSLPHLLYHYHVQTGWLLVDGLLFGILRSTTHTRGAQGPPRMYSFFICLSFVFILFGAWGRFPFGGWGPTMTS